MTLWTSGLTWVIIKQVAVLPEIHQYYYLFIQGHITVLHDWIHRKCLKCSKVLSRLKARCWSHVCSWLSLNQHVLLIYWFSIVHFFVNFVVLMRNISKRNLKSYCFSCIKWQETVGSTVINSLIFSECDLQTSVWYYAKQIWTRRDS